MNFVSKHIFSTYFVHSMQTSFRYHVSTCFTHYCIVSLFRFWTIDISSTMKHIHTFVCIRKRCRLIDTNNKKISICCCKKKTEINILYVEKSSKMICANFFKHNFLFLKQQQIDFSNISKMKRSIYLSISSLQLNLLTHKYRVNISLLLTKIFIHTHIFSIIFVIFIVNTRQS